MIITRPIVIADIRDIICAFVCLTDCLDGCKFDRVDRCQREPAATLHLQDR